LLEDKQEEAASLKEQGQEIPDDFYYTKWVRYFADQRLIPAGTVMSSSGGISAAQPNASMMSPTSRSVIGGEETKLASKSKMEPTFPAPHEDMIVKVQSQAGVVEVSQLTYRLNEDFRAGTYILTCKDVTPGLPPRMQMKHTKILIKLVDLDPILEEETKVDPRGKPKGKK